MIKFLKIISLLVCSNFLLSMDKDDKHSYVISFLNSELKDKEEIAFITRNNFKVFINEHCSIMSPLSDILYDYVWLFNAKQVAHQNLVNKLAIFSPDGKYLATDCYCKEDREKHKLPQPYILMHELRGNEYKQLNKKTFYTSNSHQTKIKEMVFSNDGKYLASHDVVSLKVWEFNSKNRNPLSLIQKIDLIDIVMMMMDYNFHLTSTYDIRFIKFSVDNSRLFLGYKKKILYTLHIFNGKIDKIFENFSERSKISPDNKFIITNDYDLKIWDINNNKEKSIKHGIKYISQIWFLDDHIIFGKLNAPKNLFGKYDIDKEKLDVLEIKDNTYSICSVEMSKDKKYLLCNLKNDKLTKYELLVIQWDKFIDLVKVNVDYIDKMVFTENGQIIFANDNGITFLETSNLKDRELNQNPVTKSNQLKYNYNKYGAFLVALVVFAIYELIHEYLSYNRGY